MEANLTSQAHAGLKHSKRACFLTRRAGIQESSAFHIALQHSSFHSAGSLCRLLCVSKDVGRMVSQACAGQLAASFILKDTPQPPSDKIQKGQLAGAYELCDVRQIQHMGRWIAKYGQLLRSLTITKAPWVDTWHFARTDSKLESHMAGHLAAALPKAARGGLLPLQSVKVACGSVAGPILRSLSAQYLTKLHIRWGITKRPKAVAGQHVISSLSRLTGLQQLTVEPRWPAVYCDDSKDGYAASLISALAPLIRLTNLGLRCVVQDLSLLGALPHQLQMLEIRPANQHRDQPSSDDSAAISIPKQQCSALQLQHLTALTCLEIKCRYKIRKMDVLPASLQVLSLSDCLSGQPLLQLHHLQQLTIHHCATPGAELQQLSRLTGLSDVRLDYRSMNTDHLGAGLAGGAFEAAAASAWEVLPGLRVLSINDVPGRQQITAATIHAIKKATNLEILVIQRRSMTQQAAAELPAMLQQLQTLKTLYLSDTRVTCAAHGGDEHVAANAQASDGATCSNLVVDVALAASLATLPLLTTLCLDGLPMVKAVAATALSHARQLMSLSMQECDLTDDVLVCLLASLHMLQQLNLSYNTSLTSISAPTIGRLTRLTQLSLAGTQIDCGELQH